MAKVLKGLRKLKNPDTFMVKGDCIQRMGEMDADGMRFDMIFADPPFNQEVDYGTCKDNLSAQEYLLWTKKWISRCSILLREGGAFWINCPDSIAADIVLHAREDTPLKMVNWCFWHHRFGVWRPNNFIVSKTHVLYFCKGLDEKLRTWNGDDVAVPSDRASRYRDKRTEDTRNPGKRVPLDVWGYETDCQAALWEPPVDELVPRPIPGHDGYFATFDGRILSRRGREETQLQLQTNADGYLTVKVANADGVFERIGVHRLVCAAFHGSPAEGLQCRHLDGIRTNNVATNLQWGTAQENAADRSVHGNWKPRSGEDHPGAKLTYSQVVEIRSALAAGVLSQREIAESFDVSPAQISRIKNSARWAPRDGFGFPSDGPGLGRVQGNSKERRELHPNQLPEVYLERVIRATTNEGDLILDPFLGSGTTCTVARALKRRSFGIELNKEFAESAWERIQQGAVRV